MGKTITISFCLAIAAFVCVQPCLSAQKPARKGISAEEKRELEKRFQGLNTFYIDDDGAVVYLQKEAVIDSIADPAAKTAAVPYTKTKIKVYINEWGEYVVSTEETANERYDGEEIPTEGGQPVEINEPATVHSESLAAGNTRAKVQKNKKSDASSFTETADAQKPKPSKKSSAPKTQSTSTSYNSLEMAMADVDQLLEELKKQQNQKSSKGRIPLSQRASSGVDGSLRGQTYELDDYEEQSQPAYSEYDEEADSNSDPTYYIDGVVATKKEVSKLKTSDILKKEIKISKTNPNGEWWIVTIPKNK
ncbi:MAG: hypothetical protein LBR34_12110 [Prevotella sp.]|jgi:hypothetical protein|nr:hypothetical protein [Prevotella sp.]